MVGVVEPFSNEIWNNELYKYHNNMISTSNEIIRLTLLPRVKGIFKRDGLYVNKFRYKSNDFKDRYLANEECVVSYDPNNIGKNGCSFTTIVYSTRFNLISIMFSLSYFL